MRFILSLVLYVGILAAIGCGDSGPSPIKEATAEDIQMQKEAEKQVKVAESQRKKGATEYDAKFLIVRELELGHRRQMEAEQKAKREREAAEKAQRGPNRK